MQQGSILLSVGKIEGGFQQLSTLMGAAGQEDGLPSVVINSAHLCKKDASHYQFGVTGASGLVQNHSLSKVTETLKAGLAVVVAEQKDKKAVVKDIKVQLFAQLYEFPSDGKPMKLVCGLHI